MTECIVCSASAFLYACSTRGEQFCADHQPPAAHNCSGAATPDASPTDAVDAAATDATSPHGEPRRDHRKRDDESRRSGPPSKPLLARIDRRRPIGLAVLLVVLVGAALVLLGPAIPATLGLPSGSGETVAAPVDELDTPAVETAVLAEVNRERRESDLDAMKSDARLRKIARSHSQHMAANDYVAHESLSGETRADRFGRLQYACERSGELVLFTYYRRPIQIDGATERYETGTNLARGIVESWLLSDPHRRSLLDQSWTHAGVGIAISPEGTVYATTVLSTAPGES